MDLRMPGISGMAVYKQIILRQPEIASRIVITTGDSLGIDVKSFVGEHRLEILKKPFDQVTVKKTVDHILQANT
jgi:DNA-binding NtrC family response regulator